MWPPSQMPLAFFKEVPFTCTSTSDEQMRPGSEPRPSAHGVNPRVHLVLESHFGPVWHEWLYLHSQKITEKLKAYHDDNVGTQSAGTHSLPPAPTPCRSLTLFYLLQKKSWALGLHYGCQQMGTWCYTRPSTTAWSTNRSTPGMGPHSTLMILPR